MFYTNIIYLYRDLTGNYIEELPDSIKNLTKLENVKCKSRNQFEEEDRIREEKDREIRRKQSRDSTLGTVIGVFFLFGYPLILLIFCIVKKYKSKNKNKKQKISV